MTRLRIYHPVSTGQSTHAISFFSSFQRTFAPDTRTFQHPPSRVESGCKDTTFFHSAKINFQIIFPSTPKAPVNHGYNFQTFFRNPRFPSLQIRPPTSDFAQKSTLPRQKTSKTWPKAVYYTGILAFRHTQHPSKHPKTHTLHAVFSTPYPALSTSGTAVLQYFFNTSSIVLQ